jgi:hypothetical protein
MIATPTTTPFLGLIEPYEWNLLTVARPQFIIEAFTGDLDRVTRGKRFRFRNHALWLMLLDTRDMLVIQLASWVRSIVDPDGLLARLQQHHASDLPRKLLPEDPRSADEPERSTRSTRERREGEHASSFDRLFPNAGDIPKESDFEGLRQTFRSQMKPVKNDRDWNRAHPFEKVSGTAKMLDVAELRAHIDYAERFMNDLRMVGWHGTFAYHEMNMPIAADFAPDLVDAMLIGGPERLLKARGLATREEFYAQLHSAHDVRPANDGDYFNDFWRAAPLIPVSSPGGS